MIKLFKRKEPSQLEAYHAPDFRSQEWDVIPPVEGVHNGPMEAVDYLPGERAEAFRPLDPRTFSADLAAADAVRRKNGILTFDLIVAAPKSFSIAALASPLIDPVFLRIHEVAVNAVIAETAALIGVPPSAKTGPEWLPTTTQIWRFRHAFNVDLGPHLHDHICFFNFARGPGRCIDGAPFFDHLLALDAIYHHGLLTGLAQAGVAVEKDAGAPYWAWRIAGVPQELLQLWASAVVVEESGYPGHIQRLEGRKEKPKLHGVPLSWARKRWLREKLVSEIQFHRRGVTQTPSGGTPDVFGCFRQAGIMSRLQLFASHLINSLAAPIPIADERSRFDRALAAAVDGGKVLHHKHRVFCHPETCEAQAKLFQWMKDGRGKGLAVTVRAKDDTGVFPGLVPILRAGTRPDRIKIARLSRQEWLSSDGKLIQPPQLSVTPECSLVAGFGHGVREIAKRVEQAPPGTPVFLLLMQGEHDGPFWPLLLKMRSPAPGTLGKKTKFHVGAGRTIRVRGGTVAWNDRTLRGLLSAFRKDRLDCVVAPEGMSTQDFRRLKLQVLKHLDKVHPPGLLLETDELLEWPDPDCRESVIGKSLIAVEANRIIRRGRGWIAQVCLGDRLLLARSLKTKQWLDWKSLDGLSRKLCFVDRQELLVPYGIPLRITRAIDLPGLRLPKGALVTPQSYDKATWSLECSEGITLPFGYRLLEPVVVSREIPQGGIHRLILEAPRSMRFADWCDRLPLNTHTDVLSPEPEALCLEIGMEIARRSTKDSKDKEAFKVSGGGFFPDFNYWEEQLRLARLLRPLPVAQRRSKTVNPPKPFENAKDKPSTRLPIDHTSHRVAPSTPSDNRVEPKRAQQTVEPSELDRD